MKKAIAMVITGFIFLLPSCKKKDKFTDPDIILKRWTRAIEEINYAEYSRCEAYPKPAAVFAEMYKEYYLRDLMITDIEDLDKKNVVKSPDGNKFIQRRVAFEAAEVKRATRQPVKLVRGDVAFIRFLEGARQADGWLMWNRSLVRIDR